MTHKFDVNNRNKLDNPKRREMLPVDEILTRIGVKEEDKLADIGCGIGYFSIPAAQVVGSNGSVYALDVEPKMLEVVEEKKEKNNLMNIQTLLTEEYDLKLEDAVVSYGFMCTVLHEIEDKSKFLEEANRIIMKDGKIAILEWMKKESDWGPSINHRVDSSEVMKLLLETGFRDNEMIELNEYFYVVIATK